MKDEYDKTAERIHALDMPMESYQVGTNKIAALLREAFPEHAQAAPSDQNYRSIPWEMIENLERYSIDNGLSDKDGVAEILALYGYAIAPGIPQYDRDEAWFNAGWDGCLEDQRKQLNAQVAPSEDVNRIIGLLRLALIKGLPKNDPWALSQLDNLRAALASERGKREGACSGCVLAHTDDRPCAKCRRAAPVDVALYDYYLASPAPDATALREALRVCGNCKHGQPTSLDDTRCYKATPYVPVERWAKACADWDAAPTRDNPRAALLRSEPRGEEGR